MTDADLEPAARRLCEIRGGDPDAHGDNSYTWGFPLWKALADEIRAHLEREQALRETEAEQQQKAFDEWAGKGLLTTNIEDTRK